MKTVPQLATRLHDEVNPLYRNCMAPSPVGYIDKTTTAMAGHLSKPKKKVRSPPRTSRNSLAAGSTGTVEVAPPHTRERSTRVGPDVAPSPVSQTRANAKLAASQRPSASAVGSPESTLAMEATTTVVPRGSSSKTTVRSTVGKGSSSKPLAPVQEEAVDIIGNINGSQAKSDNGAEQKTEEDVIQEEEVDGDQNANENNTAEKGQRRRWRGGGARRGRRMVLTNCSSRLC